MSRVHKILVVDDTPLNVKLLADLLAVSGYEVDTAGGGEEGLAKVASFAPDLLLLDVVMPGMSGYEVCIQVVTCWICRPSLASCSSRSWLELRGVFRQPVRNALESLYSKRGVKPVMNADIASAHRC